MRSYSIIFCVILFLCPACENFVIDTNPHDPYTESGAGSYTISGLRASSDQYDKIVLLWDELQYAEGYVIYRSEESNTGFSELDKSVTNSYADNLAVAETMYYYRIRGILKTGKKTDMSQVVQGKRRAVAGSGSPTIAVSMGQETVTAGEVLNIGRYVVGEAGRPLTFTISNTGSGDLELQGVPLISVTDNEDEYFIVSEQPAFNTIAEGASLDFSLIFYPGEEGDRSADVVILTNDDTTPTFSFSLEANTYWDKRFDIANDNPTCIAVDSAGNVIMGALVSDQVTAGSKFDWVIIKFDASGDELWRRVYDGAGNDDLLKAIALDADDNIYAVGYGAYMASTTSLRDWWIKKLDPAGNDDTVNWNKIFDGRGSTDMATDVVIGSNDRVYVVGVAYNLVTIDSGYDWWIKVFTTAGVEVWEKKIDASGTQLLDIYAALDGQNNLYVTGHGYNVLHEASDNDWVIKKFRSTGVEDTAWDIVLDGYGYDTNPQAITVDSAGNVYVGGYGDDILSTYSDHDWVIKKFSGNGVEDTTYWNLSFDGADQNDEIYDMICDAADNLYVAGIGSRLIDEGSGSDWWIKKFDTDGNEDVLVWDKKLDWKGRTDKAFGIAIGPTDIIYVAGYGQNLISSTSGYDFRIKSYYYEE